MSIAGRAGPAGLLSVALSALVSLAYALGHPPAADLAAQTARAELVERAGAVVWWTRWYAGLETPSYGLVTPSLMAAVGVTAVGVLALLATGVLAPLVVRGARRPVLGALALVVMQAANLYAGRTTFALGGAVALAVVALVERGRTAPAAALAVLTTLTSPVAGLILGVPLGATLLAAPARRRAALWAGVSAAGALGALAVLFPSGGNGEQPFAGWLLRDCLLVTLLTAVLPVGRRVRTAAVLTAVLLVAAFLLPTAVGSNASRVPLLLAVPAVAASARLRAPVLALALLVLAAFPADQLRDDLGGLDRSRTTAAYYAPLIAALEREPLLAAGSRVEVVEPRDHWHAAHVARHVALARGWQRQADVERSEAIYAPDPLAPAPLTAQSYRAFLDANAVAVVAVAPDAPVDFASVQERTLVLGGLPYLDDAGRHGAWQVFRVRDPAPLVSSGPAEVVSVDDSSVALRLTAPGEVRLRVRWSPYLVVSGPVVQRGGCVAAENGWVVLRLAEAGDYRLRARFTLGAALRTARNRGDGQGDEQCIPAPVGS